MTGDDDAEEVAVFVRGAVLEGRDCRGCGSEQWFEVPACADGHGDACPERVCTGCGSALLVGLPAPTAPAAGRAAPRPHLAVVA